VQSGLSRRQGARLPLKGVCVPANSVSRIVRFGKFEVDLQTGELRKYGL
jgi:hypothetical protein